VSHKFIG